MNKQKLISLIIKKQTYKETKVVQADIAKKKQQAVNVSISAIYHIFHDDYNAEAKLYAVRYLKDCFEKGNSSFIMKTEQKILPLLVKFVEDSHNDQAVLKYGGSYTKNVDLQKFKSLITSFFIMSRQCIQKWEKWIADPNRKFSKAQKKIVQQFGEYKEPFQYFREDSQRIFRQNCKKNGVKLPIPVPAPVPISNENLQKLQKNFSDAKSQQLPLKQPINPINNKKIEESFHKAPSAIKPNKNSSSITRIAEKVEQNMDRLTVQQFQKLEKQFNAALNEYIQQTDQFDQQFIDQSIEYFQNLKKRFEANKNEENNQSSSVKMKINDQSLSFQNKNQINKNQLNSVKQSHRKQQNNKTNKNNPNFILDVQKISEKNNPSAGIELSIMSKQHQEKIVFEVSDHSSDENEQTALIKKDTAKFGGIQSKTIKNSGPLPPKKVKKLSKPSQASKISQNSQDIKNGEGQSNIKFSNSYEKSFSNHESSQGSKQGQNNMSQMLKKEDKISPSAISQAYLVKEQTNLKEKQEMQSKMMTLQNQIKKLQGSQMDLMGQVHNKKVIRKTTDLHSIRQELLQEKKQKNLLHQEVNQLKNQLRRMKTQARSPKSYLSLSPSGIQPSKLQSPKYHVSKLNSGISKSNYKTNNLNHITLDNEEIYKNNFDPISKLSQTMGKEQPYSPRIDQDYIENKTHYSNIGSWISEENVERFKLCILNLNLVFYENEDIVLSKVDNLFSQNHFDYLKMTFSFKFRRCQEKIPKTSYKNIPEVDLWTKSIQGKLDSYMQEIVGRLCSVPLKIMKGSITGDNNSKINFLLPFMYFSYLKTTEFTPEQFQDIYRSKYDSIIKSKVFYLNPSLADSPKKYSKIFKNSAFKNNFLEFCFQEQSHERVFLTQLQFLKNQKAIIRIIPIPLTGSMGTKAKQLLNNLVFLIGE